ncbi:MAG: putative enoyl-CoA hydratase echA12 [Alphaproteobacteria bacterium MarineAlpha4_Bin2]|nr:MAG: putative enoyl-CoA hydratase echA12 [Alphaproteobacteria bacterium MarineAlpha4_Bin2]
MKTGIDLAILNGIATITINRPNRRNALDIASTAAFKAAVHEINGSDKVQAVVITGTGGVFCAGADLSEMADKGAVYQPWAGTDGPLARPCDKPVIAAIEGYAVAGGLGVALWADLRVASESAVFGVFCRRFGVPMSDGTPTRLPKVVGRSRALDMLLTGRPVYAEEAVRIGLSDRLVPEGKALDMAQNLADEISGFPTLAMRADRLAAWCAHDGDETAMLIRENEGAQAAKITEAANGAIRFKRGAGRGGSGTD